MFVSTPAPIVHTDRGCYLVNQRVMVTGSGFAPSRPFTVTIDGVYFGKSTTDANGGFRSSLLPGGLGAGQAEHVDHLVASDGTGSGATKFTLTRKAGARFLATRGNPHTLRAPFEVWGFALDGASKPVYIHYVSPAGSVRKTVLLGHTSGQCGYVLTHKRRVFPFSPSKGSWTLQLDTDQAYTAQPAAPVTRIRVKIT